MSTQPRSTALLTCGYEGNSDVYGLGIRVGIYLQWISGLLSKAFLEEKDLRDVLNENAIFLLAIFLATVLLVTDTISGVHGVDILIMLHIFFGSIYTIFVDEHIIARIEYFSSLIGILFKSGIATGMAAIGVWFWFYDTPIPLNSNCSQYAFLFGRVGFYSKSTIMVFKAFAVVNLMLCASTMLGTILVRIYVWIFRAFLILKPFPSEGLLGLEEKPTMAIKLRRWIISGRYHLFLSPLSLKSSKYYNSVPAKTDYYQQLKALELQSLDEFQKRMGRVRRRSPDGPIAKIFQSFECTTKLLKFLDSPLDVIISRQQKILGGTEFGERYPGLVGLFSVGRRYTPPLESKPENKRTLQEVSSNAIKQGRYELPFHPFHQFS